MASEYKTFPQEFATVGPGLRIPLLGLGTWKSKAGEVEAAVEAAIKHGYRHIDCAHIYQNEGEVGSALSKVWADGVLGRADVWLTSKLWNDAHAAGDVEPACRKTLAALGVEYLDLYLMHWPVTGNKGPKVDPPIEETWRAMEALVAKGLVKAIGVSNFSVKKLQDLLSYASVRPAVNQVEAHPYWRQQQLVDWCASEGIHVTAYSPFASPDSATMFKREYPSLFKDETVEAVAARCGKTPAQVLLRWAVQRSPPTSVIPKSVTPSRIAQNADIFSWSLPPEDFDALSSLPFQRRAIDGSFWVTPEGPYTSMAELWDE